MAQRVACLYPIFSPRARLLIMEKPAPVAVTIGKALSVPPAFTTQQRISLKLSIFRPRIIQRVVQAAAFFPAQRRIDDHRRDRGEISKLQQIDRHLKIPIKLTNLALKVAQARAGTLQ